jgi:excisionase family DNA binding protein
MRPFYTTFEAARVLGVSLPTVVNWIKARRIKAHRTPGGHRRIAREDLAAFMLQQGMSVPDELAGAAPARQKVLVVDVSGPAREGSARKLAAAGFAVEQELRGLREDRELAHVPVVAIGPAGWREALLEAGCTEALARPPSDAQLGEALRRALSRPEPDPRSERTARTGRARPGTTPAARKAGGPAAD